MFFYEGFSCPVCGQLFTESDDIVACPKCGAPHHRACWQSVGHCALQEDHDTSKQWSRETAQNTSQSHPENADALAWTCPACSSRNLEYAEFCAHCGRERQSAPDWHSQPQSKAPNHQAGGTAHPYREYTPFHVGRPMPDPYGGVDPNEMMDDMLVSDAVAYVGVNSHYYIPRFKNITSGNAFSWNWAAFFFGPYWLLYRKNFLAGFILLAVSIVQSVLSYQISAHMLDMIGSGLSQVEMAERMMALAAENPTFKYLMYGLLLLMLVELAMRLLVGFAGNWIYQKTAFSRIRKLKEKKPERYPYGLSQIGGISFLAGMLAYLLSDYLIQFIFIL